MTKASNTPEQGVSQMPATKTIEVSASVVKAIWTLLDEFLWADFEPRLKHLQSEDDPDDIKLARALERAEEVVQQWRIQLAEDGVWEEQER
jgi:hypothetical protein